MQVKLHVQIGRKRNRTLTLRGDEAVIGRARGNAVRIPSNDVSRRHCKLCIEGDEVTIQDLDSLNGTFLNEERVEGVQLVQSGDRIQVGPVTLIVEYEGAELLEVAPEDEELDVELVDEDDDLGDLMGHIGLGDDGGPGFEVAEEPAPPKKKSKIDMTGKQKTVPPPDRTPPKKSKPPKEDDDAPIPLAGDEDTKKREPVFLDDDQAWVLPEPTEFRDILEGLDEAEAVEDDEGK